MTVLAVLAALSLLQGGAAARPANVRAAYTIEPETVRVGDPATLRVRLTAPAGARIVWPGAVDSTSGVEPLDPVSVREETKNGVLESVATYRLLAWEVGLPSISIAPIRVDVGGAVQELRLGDPRVFVVTVLPADTTLRTPRPSRGIAFLSPSDWPTWVLIAAGFLLAILVGIWLQRRGRRGPRPIEPAVQAQRAFGKLAALDLIGAGEPARHVATSADILREFLATRAAATGLGLTTAELMRALAGDSCVPLHRVSELLAAADDVKFAEANVDAPAAEGFGAEAASIVSEVHRLDVRRVREK
jgi:hypothetical protein